MNVKPSTDDSRVRLTIGPIAQELSIGSDGVRSGANLDDAIVKLRSASGSPESTTQEKGLITSKQHDQINGRLDRIDKTLYLLVSAIVASATVKSEEHEQALEMIRNVVEKNFSIADFVKSEPVQAASKEVDHLQTEREFSRPADQKTHSEERGIER